MAEEKTIFLRGLADNAKTDEIFAKFEKFGKVKDVYIPRDYYTKRPRNFCYVK